MMMAQSPPVSKMPRRYPRCERVKDRSPCSKVEPFKPKTCLCLSEGVNKPNPRRVDAIDDISVGMIAQSLTVSKMPRRYPRCEKVKHRSPSSKVESLEPKTCLCRSERVDDEPVVEPVQEDPALHKNGLTLTPKASTDIVEKPEVQDVETAIFLERIVSLFGRVMKKLELAAALPILLADPEISRILTAAEMDTVQGAFEHQDVPRDRQRSLVNSGSPNSSQRSFGGNGSESTCSTTFVPTGVYEALQTLNRYAAVREKIKSSRRDIAPQCHLFLQHMRYFVEHCALRIRATPLQEKMREVHFRKLWHENHRAQQDIAALMKFLEAQRSSHHNLIKAIDAQYQKDFVTVERLNRKCADDIKSTMYVLVELNRSERRQIFEHKSSEVRQNDLSQLLVISRNKLENLRDTNLRLEQDIRSKRFKVSSQLLALIGKFDTEVGERYKLLEQLNGEFEADRRTKEELEEEMTKQFEIYSGFVEEREQTILAIFRDRYDKFVRTRAAKVIQRWWRPIFKRLKLKTKKKKKSKKRKTK